MKKNILISLAIVPILFSLLFEFLSYFTKSISEYIDEVTNNFLQPLADKMNYEE